MNTIENRKTLHICRDRQWSHSHRFNLENVGGERSTWYVIGLTVTMMVVEIAAGFAYGSMALLADGWHMSTHAAALGITAFTYNYARRHADSPQYSFGTGKMSALGGFSSAIVLAVAALLMGIESIERFLFPQNIQFNQAILVAVLGLIVNLVSAFLLKDHHHGHGHFHDDHDDHDHHADHDHDHDEHDHDHHADHDHDHDEHDHDHHTDHDHDEHDHHDDHDHDHHTDHDHDHDDHDHDHHADHDHDEHNHHDDHDHDRHVDHNLKSAYLHVIADALTSVLAIIALLTGKNFGWVWMDALMGIIGAIIILRWSYGLLNDTSKILLDSELSQESTDSIRSIIESDKDSKVSDLHVWQLSSNQAAAIISITTHLSKTPNDYKDQLSAFKELKHITVEVNQCLGNSSNH